MKTTLVIMAAGIGSRFGGGIKQLEPVGLHNEIIMDYSIHDAIEAGFQKIVFIIRKDIREDFMEVIGNRIEAIAKERNVEVAYAYQSLQELPNGVVCPDERAKPWGTGQAVLCAKEHIDGPFAVINADDYYGKEAFVEVFRFLQNYDASKPYELCMAGFILKNTLSENGGVTRGVCECDDKGYLTNIHETKNIVKTENGAEADGVWIDIDSHVSMNFFGLTPEFLDLLEEGFVRFFEKKDGDMLKNEYLLPIYIGELLQKNQVSVKVLETTDRWFGVTYKEDKEAVMQSFRQLIEAGVYKESLWG